MATYFFDTSAVAKRYVPEPGHRWVQNLCRPKAGNTIIIAEVTLVEVVASLCRMARVAPQRLSLAQRERLIALFRRHAQREFSVLSADRLLLTNAADLCRTHPLRAYDAVQLATALALRGRAAAIGATPPIFVCAYTALLAVAKAEGLTVDNPNDHP